jgi:DNA primase catalytic core
MPLISKEFIDDLNQTPIEDIAARMGLKAKKLKGDEFIIPCVSYDHDDNNPSMSISTSKQEFFCHSCNCSGGGAINFLSAYNGINSKTDFIGAIEAASSFLGRDIIYEKENENTVTQRDAINYASAALNNQERPTAPLLAEFISSRGITRNDIAEWGLQYAQKGFGLKFQKSLVPTLSDMGLATVMDSKKQDGSTFQFFPLNERLVFPINNERGQLVAFAGRKLSDDAYGPKYKNTENTALFTKMNTLYGLDKVISNHKSQDKEGKIADIQVLEGYMDVIATHRVGYKTSVAAMGTSFPESQLELLSKHAKGITFMFDSDAAGIKASQGAMLKSCKLADKMRFRFAFSPDHNGVKTDPDYLISNGLLEEYADAINNALPLSAVAAQYVLAESDINQVEDLIGQPSVRAKEIYLSMPAGIVREAFSQELAKLISDKIGFNIDPSMMGMRLDDEAIHLNKGIETKNSIKLNTQSDTKSNNQPTNISKPKTPISVETNSIAEFISAEQPNLDDWVLVSSMEDEMLQIGKVLSSDQGMLTLDMPNSSVGRRKINSADVVKINAAKTIKSKYANADRNVAIGDTIILLGEKWYNDLAKDKEVLTEKKLLVINDLKAEAELEASSSPVPGF